MLKMIKIKVIEEGSERDSLALINPLQILDVTRVGEKRYKLSLNSWDFELKDFKHHILPGDSLVELLEAL
jgi:hypothetical protein